VNDHPSDPAGIDELIHLRVMRENENVLSEATVIANTDEKAVADVDRRGRGQRDVLAEVHAERAKGGPAMLETPLLRTLHDPRGDLHDEAEHLRDLRATGS
jgi:hypothetical protein